MKLLGQFLKIGWKVKPVYMVLLFFQAFISPLQVVLNLYISKCIVDELVGAKDVQTLLFFAVCLVANNVGLTWLSKLFERLVNVRHQSFKREMLEALSKKIMNLEYSYLEDPTYLDLKERAVFAISNQDAIGQTIKCFADTVSGIMTVVSLFVIICQLGWVMVVAFVVTTLLSLLAIGVMMKKVVKIQQILIPVNRKMSYYVELMTEKQYQKDIRLYDMSDMIAERAVKFTNECMDEFQAVDDTQGIVMGIIGALASGLAAFSYAYVGLRTISPDFGPMITIGSLTMYVTATINLSKTCSTLGESMIGMFQEVSFLEPYMEFMNLEEETMESDKEKFHGPVETIEFRDVTFTYPKAEKPILKNLTFEIQKGEKISIVGLNGAGKSTLVKLICRMYKSDSGEILVNGKNIYDYDYMSYMKEIAAVFQDYKLFNFTIEENVSCQPTGADIEEVNRLLDEVGLTEKIKELPNGIKSQFGKEYDEEGIEFSGGQAQKVAIARALYKESSLVIMDEPASALDPIAEAEIYEKFNRLVSDKTALYISHRMSSSVFCDKILIIDGGTVTDFDSHENLMQKTDSLYYKLFMAQAENYALEN